MRRALSLASSIGWVVQGRRRFANFGHGDLLPGYQGKVPKDEMSRKRRAEPLHRALARRALDGAVPL